ncbi:MAG: AsmA-like C-terminal region-containing protein [Planctomycetaceae bacterium]|nr:AsmA-like C-terminal region-containing protein [Planctomycetaceae bacterium]
MLLLCVSVIVVFFVYRNFNNTLRNIVTQKFSDVFPHLSVDFDSIFLQESEGVVLRGVRFSGDTGHGSKRMLLEAEEIFIHVPIHVQAYLQDEAVPQKLEIKKSKIHLTLDENGKLWGGKCLTPVQKEKHLKIPIDFRDASLVYHDLRKENFAPILFSGGHLSVLPPNYPSPNREKKPSPFWTMTGSMSNALVRQLTFSGFFDENTKDFLFHGDIQEFRWSPEFEQLAEWDDGQLTQTLKSFSAKWDYQFTLGRDTARLTQAPWGVFLQGHGRMYEGRLSLPIHVKGPVTEISADFQMTEDSFQATNIHAISGATSLAAVWRQNGLYPVREAVFQSRVRELAFNNEFIESLGMYLPEKVITFLQMFQYSGTADLTSTLQFDGTHWNPQEVDCRFHELNVSYEKFPYQQDHFRGTITVTPEDTLTLDLKTQKEKNNVTLTGKVLQINSSPQGQITIVANSVPIDEKLMKAIPHETAKSAIRSLQANGMFTAFFQLTLPGGGAPFQTFLQIAPEENCSIQYDKFPLRLSQVKGVIEMRENAWYFRDMNARHGSAHIFGKGHLLAVQPEEYEFRLSLDAGELDVGTTLTDAILNENQREMIAGLNLKGTADFSDVEILYHTGRNTLSVSFDAEFPHPENTSVKPDCFPYRLENVRAKVHYRDGEIQVDHFSGQNNDTRVSGSLTGHFSPEGSCAIVLKKMLAEQVYHEKNLLSAIPSDLREIISQLNIQESVAIQGEMLFRRGSQPQAPVQTAWNIGVVLLQNKVSLGNIPVSDIYGKVHLLGRNTGIDHLILGEIELDACNYEGFPITDIHGPFCFYDQRLSLGRDARIPQSCVQGQLSLEGFLDLPIPQFSRNPLTEQVSFVPSQGTPPPMMPPVYTFNGVINHQETNPLSARNSVNSPAMVPLRSMTGNLFGGIFLADGNVFLSPAIAYRFDMQLNNLDMETASMQMMTQNKGVGKLSATASISGEGKSRDTVKGNGKLQIREANLYQFPIMQELAKYLRLKTEKDQNGITSCDVTFQIQGNKASLDPISLDGTLISLTGQGDMNLDTTNVSLSLGVRLGNSQSQIPLLSDIVGGAGDQLLKLRVEGSLHSGTLGVKRDTLLKLQEQSEPKPGPLKRMLNLTGRQ